MLVSEVHISMALPVAFNQQTNPFALGLITVNPAGTAIHLTKNFTGMADVRVASIRFDAPAANTGVVYILTNPGNPPWTLPGGATTSGVDSTNFLNCVAIIPKGTSWIIDSDNFNNLGIDQFWVDVASGGDSVIASALIL